MNNIEDEYYYAIKDKDGVIYNPSNLFKVGKNKKKCTESTCKYMYAALNESYHLLFGKTQEEMITVKKDVYIDVMTKSGHYTERHIEDYKNTDNLHHFALAKHEKFALKKYPFTMVKITMSVTKIEECPEILI
jgi:hypothetical protein